MHKIFPPGNDLAAQLGIGHSIGDNNTLNRIKFLSDFVDESKREKNDHLKVVTTTLYSLVLHKNRLYRFGCNDEGTLGCDGNKEYPAMVSFPFFTKNLKCHIKKINQPNIDTATKKITNKNKESADKNK